MAIYPANPNLAQGTSDTPANPTSWNTLIDNINAIGDDLVDGRGDGQTFPGTPHTAGQATDIDGILQAIKHMLSDIGGEVNWYDDPGANLKVHDHSTGKGGAVPWSSIDSGSRKIQLHAEYAGAIWTDALRGDSPSGNNTGTKSIDLELDSNATKIFYEFTSAETSLQDYYVCLLFTLPDWFGSWASENALQIEFRSESNISINCHVDIYVYKSGSADQVASSTDNANVAWSTITIDDSSLGSWAAGDIIEIWLKLETRNDYYARVGKITFNITTKT